MTLDKEYHKVKLGNLTPEIVEHMRLERNEVRESLRTPYFLTEEMQQRFYKDVVSNRNANSRFYALNNEDGKNIGMGGFTPISWENRTAEISIILRKSETENGYGKKGVKALLDEAFGNLNLNLVYGECYNCSPAIVFWQLMVNGLHFYSTRLKKRKYFNGVYYDSLYFSTDKDNWERLNKRKGLN